MWIPNQSWLGVPWWQGWVGNPMLFPIGCCQAAAVVPPAHPPRDEDMDKKNMAWHILPGTSQWLPLSAKFDPDELDTDLQLFPYHSQPACLFVF